jgi:hypothetical protein
VPWAQGTASPLTAWNVRPFGKTDEHTWVFGYYNDTPKPVLVEGDVTRTLATDLQDLMTEESARWRAERQREVDRLMVEEGRADESLLHLADRIAMQVPYVEVAFQYLDPGPRTLSTANSYPSDAEGTADALNELARDAVAKVGLRAPPFKAEALAIPGVPVQRLAITTEILSARQSSKDSPGGGFLRVKPRARASFLALGRSNEILIPFSKVIVIRSNMSPPAKPDPFANLYPVTLVAVDAPGQPGLSYVEGVGHCNVFGQLTENGGAVMAPVPTRFAPRRTNLCLEALDHSMRRIAFGEDLVARVWIAFAAPSSVGATLWSRFVAEKRQQMRMLGHTDSDY